MASPLAQRLATAWINEGPEAWATQGPLGEETTRAVEEALLEHCFQSTLNEAIGLMDEKQREGVSLLQREAERLSCLTNWPGETGREMALLALPCGTDAGGLAHWLLQPNHRQAIGHAFVRHLASRWKISEDAMEKMVLFPVPVTPESVASLTSDARRRLLEELMAGQNNGEIFQHLMGSRVEPSVATSVAHLLPSEGLLLFAVGVRTDWQRLEGSDPSDRMRDMLHEQLPAEEVQAFEEDWMALWARLPDVPPLAYTPQPTSLIHGLMQLLHSRVMNVRFAHEDSDTLLNQLENHQPVTFSRVSKFRASHVPGNPRRMQIEAFTETGPLPIIDVSNDWALANGMLALQVLLAQAFDIGTPQWEGAAEAAPHALHPAWDRALPPAPGLH